MPLLMIVDLTSRAEKALRQRNKWRPAVRPRNVNVVGVISDKKPTVHPFLCKNVSREFLNTENKNRIFTIGHKSAALWYRRFYGF